MYNEIVSQLCSEVKAELENNILPFWMTKMTDHEHGGFYAVSQAMTCWRHQLRKEQFSMHVFCGLSLLLIAC